MLQKQPDKRAFLVLGPESSGTRLMTGILIAAGCYGDSGHEQRLDSGIPDNEPLIVWRRSVPHRGQWPQLNVAFNLLERNGYEVTVLIMSRDWHSMAISQELAPHADDVDVAQENIRRAYIHIFQHIRSNRFEIVNYEALTQRPGGTIKYLCGRLGLPEPVNPPAIYDGNSRYYPDVTITNPVSQLCTQSQFDEPVFSKWVEAMGLTFAYHRKLWEFVYIAQALDLAGMLQPGRCGLGFGVGREILPAVFAAHGVSVLATDRPEGGMWVGSGQHSAAYYDLPYAGVCQKEQFGRLVRHELVDMNHIPKHLLDGEWDFVWSANSLDHLGSIAAGLDFIHKSLECLKPGGMAVHTTEFNTDSNDRTLDSGAVVLFREKDIRKLASDLTAAGYAVELNLSRGNGAIDQKIDRPPYNRNAHIRLDVGGYATTSIGLIIRK